MVTVTGSVLAVCAKAILAVRTTSNADKTRMLLQMACAAIARTGVRCLGWRRAAAGRKTPSRAMA